jgi:excisionase family DNA binding protein
MGDSPTAIPAVAINRKRLTELRHREEGPVYLDVVAAARRYGISARHLYRMIQRGEFPAPRRLGRLNRWALSDLLRWEERHGADCQRRSRGNQVRG